MGEKDDDHRAVRQCLWSFCRFVSDSLSDNVLQPDHLGVESCSITLESLDRSFEEERRTHMLDLQVESVLPLSHLVVGVQSYLDRYLQGCQEEDPVYDVTINNSIKTTAKLEDFLYDFYQPILDIKQVTELDVSAAINTLSSFPSCSFDGITSYIIKCDKTKLTPILSCISTKKYPELWKTAKVTPLFKDKCRYSLLTLTIVTM